MKKLNAYQERKRKILEFDLLLASYSSAPGAAERCKRIQRQLDILIKEDAS